MSTNLLFCHSEVHIKKGTSVNKILIWRKQLFMIFKRATSKSISSVFRLQKHNGRTQICDWLSQTEEMKMEMPQLSVFSRFLFLTLGTVFLFSVFLRKSGNYSMLDKWNQLFTFYLLKPIIYPINKLFSTYWIKQKAKAHFKWQCLVPE